MIRVARKELRPLIRKLEEAGAEIRIGKHPKVYVDDKFVCSLPGTAGDVRSLKNSEKQLKRLGIL